MSNPVQPLTPAQVVSAKSRAIHESYFIRSLRALDVFLSEETDGLPGETLSARWARWATMKPQNDVEKMQHNFGVFACHALNIAQQDHGALAIVGDEAHSELLAGVEQQAETQLEQEGQK